MFKRTATFMLAIALVVSGALAGCSSNSKTTESNNASETTNKDKTSETSAETSKETSTDANNGEATVIKWATVENWYPPAPLGSGLPVWKEIEQKLNITIQWDVAPDAQYVTAMQTRLAAGTDLPDILRVPGGDPTQYGQSGLLIPLEDLIQSQGQNVQKVFSNDPEARKLMTSGDGHIYGLAPIIRESSYLMGNVFTLRQDWLDKLNLKTPDTLDDWYNVLKAFRDKDPNGNGKRDEIAWGGDPLFFAEAFGLHLWASAWQGGFWADKDGKVFYQWTDPRMKELLTWLNKLYKEELLDPDYGNPSAEALQAKVTKNLVGSMNNWPDLTFAWGKVIRSSADPSARFVPVVPPQGKNGDRSLEGYGIVDMGFQGISKDCKNKEAAFKLMDYLWSEEGIRYMAWGIEGKSYTMENGKPKYTDWVMKNSDGLGMSDALRTLGSWPTIPWIQQADTYQQMLDADPDFAKSPSMMKPYLIDPFPPLLATKEEQDQLTVLNNDINTYRGEMITKFIIGQEPIENFDKFVDTLKGMNLDKLLEIKQTQYERTMNRK
jgi:putative aldouronate transport system substrate-binding protein